MFVKPGVNILIVDDEADIRGLIAYDFEAARFKVALAENGEKGIECLKREKFDLVISDIRMEKMGGEELLRVCGQLPPEQRPLVVMITGFADFSPEMAFDLGAVGYVTKPFSRKELFGTVSSCLASPTDRWRFDPSVIPRGALELEVEIEDVERAIKAGTFHLGTGGMFVGLSDAIPDVGEVLVFRIVVGSEKVQLNGAGAVRWGRSDPKQGLPTGIGLEILTLEEQSIFAVLDLNRRFPGRAYIPRC